MTKHSELDKIVQEITWYLVAHPEAKDTVEGISQWWLSPGKEMHLSIVQAALDELVASGYLIETSTGRGGYVYALAKPPKRIPSS